MKKEQPELYTPAEIAEFLKISKNQVLAYIHTGRLKAKTISPRVVRVTDRALVEFLNDAG